MSKKNQLKGIWDCVDKEQLGGKSPQSLALQIKKRKTNKHRKESLGKVKYIFKTKKRGTWNIPRNF